MQKKQRSFAPSYWVRSGCCEDANGDSRVTHTAQRFFEKLFASYNWKNGYAECADTFIDRDIPISPRSITRARKLLVELERVWIIRQGGRRGLVNLPTRYGIALYYRGSDRFRELNGGKHAVDFRDSPVTMPNDYHLAGLPVGSQGAKDDLSKAPKVHSQLAKSALPTSHRGDQTYSLLENDKGAPSGERVPHRDALGGAKEEELIRASHHQGPASTAEWHQPSGFAKWRIVHAEYVGKKGADDEDKDILLAHLRSARGAKFTLRCHIDSDDYASLDEALGFDCDPDLLKGEEMLMSTNRDGAKTFRRTAPLPWCEVTILSGESNEDGTARVRVAFHDSMGGELTMNLPAEAASALASECGGEERSVGARVRYRIMPDDSYEFRMLVTGPLAGNDNVSSSDESSVMETDNKLHDESIVSRLSKM